MNPKDFYLLITLPLWVVSYMSNDGPPVILLVSFSVGILTYLICFISSKIPGSRFTRVIVGLVLLLLGVLTLLFALWQVFAAGFAQRSYINVGGLTLGLFGFCLANYQALKQEKQEQFMSNKVVISYLVALDVFLVASAL